jgi:hypothetical protein
MSKIPCVFPLWDSKLYFVTQLGKDSQEEFHHLRLLRNLHALHPSAAVVNAVEYIPLVTSFYRPIGRQPVSTRKRALHDMWGINFPDSDSCRLAEPTPQVYQTLRLRLGLLLLVANSQEYAMSNRNTRVQPGSTK